MNDMSLKKHSIFFIFLLAVLLRLFFLKDNNVFFYFDQARDAVISQSIILEKDIKIQGPSVSGTGDSVYHGVLYYYLIAPFYVLAKGNPLMVSAVLAIIGSLSVFIVYQIGKEVFASRKVALLAAFLSAVSAVLIDQHIWLSNPQLSSLFIPLFYLYLWRIFFAEKRSKKLKDYLILALSLALALQAALQSVVLGGSLVLACIYLAGKEKTLKIFSFKELLLMAATFFLGISSMILTEILMFKRGILSFDSLRLGEHSASFSFSGIFKIIEKYWDLLGLYLVPEASVILLIIVLLPILFYLFKAEKKQLIYLAIFFLAPLWLLLWHYRDPKHSFIGLETVLYLVLAAGLVKFWEKALFYKILVAIVITIFTYSQFNQLSLWNEQRAQNFGIQKGALLKEELALIEQTYQMADGREFSFSTLTSPYAINTTWSYLYDWQGKKYGAEPIFVGMPQAGYPGEFLLEESNQASEVHFTIIESDTTLSDEAIEEFCLEQDKLAGPIKESWQFGTLILEMR